MSYSELNTRNSEGKKGTKTVVRVHESGMVLTPAQVVFELHMIYWALTSQLFDSSTVQDELTMSQSGSVKVCNLPCFSVLLGTYNDSARYDLSLSQDCDGIQL